jgi:hypothetical protein
LSLRRRPNKKAKSPVKEPVSALRTPEGQIKTESPFEYCTRVLSKERHRPYDLIRDLLGKEGSGRGDLSLCRLKQTRRFTLIPPKLRQTGKSPNGGFKWRLDLHG